MNTKFSLIYPTRHRPQFIAMALKFLKMQDYSDFEIIVSDNYLDESLNCEEVCSAFPSLNIKYIKPAGPLSMVANWNFALDHASGDYICYFTDKMFLLPGVLASVDEVVKKTNTDIVTWVDNGYSGQIYPDYFGPGFFRQEQSDVSPGESYQLFSPVEELHRKAQGFFSRSEQSASHYARGKICFGAYKRALVDRIVKNAGKLFHDLSPDYTSMILGLSFAESAVELNYPGIVHVSTDLSNGGNAEFSDASALSFLAGLESYPDLLSRTLIPGLYSSSHNCVAHDYLYLLDRFNLNYDLNRINWLTYIHEDIFSPKRKWSGTVLEKEHKRLLNDFIEESITEEDKLILRKNISRRKLMRNEKNIRQAIKNLIRGVLPHKLIPMLVNMRSDRKIKRLNHIIEILDKAHTVNKK